MRVLVTGASGFVGLHLLEALQIRGYSVQATTRDLSRASVATDIVKWVVLPDQTDRNTLARILDGVEVVVHLAARVHVMREVTADPLAEYRRVNVALTQALAEASRHVGVKRFIYLSTMKVHGEGGTVAFSESDRLSPEDPYGRSKVESESTIAEALGEAVGWTILRPPLIYGPRVGGNFRRLIWLAHLSRRVPLPLGGIRNERSLLYVGNLVDAIIGEMQTREVVGRTFAISDGQSISTSDLVRRMADALGGGLPMLPCPVPLVKRALRILEREEVGNRLFGSFLVDSRALSRIRGWTPPYTLDNGIQATAEWWKVQYGNGA